MLNQNQNPVNPSDVHLVNYRAIISDSNISLAMIDDCIKDFDGAQLVADKSAPALENDADAFEAFAVELDKISRARKDVVYKYRQTVRKLGYYMTARGLITTDKAQAVIKSMDAQLERGDETTARLEVKRGAQQYAELLRRNAQETRRDAKNADKSTQPETTPAAVDSTPVKEKSIEEKDAEIRQEFDELVKPIHAAADDMKIEQYSPVSRGTFIDALHTAENWTEKAYNDGKISVYGYKQFKSELEREKNQGALSYKNWRANIEKCKRERDALEREKIDPEKINEVVVLWAKEPQTRRSLLVDLKNHFNLVYKKRANTVMAFKYGYIDLCAALNGISNQTINAAEGLIVRARMIVKEYNEKGEESKDLARRARLCARDLSALCANILFHNPEKAAPVVEVHPVVEETPAAPVIEEKTVEENNVETVEENNVETVEENNVETVEENNVETVEEVEETTVEEIDDETTEEKERALELVATSTVERLRAGVVAWRHLSSDLETAPRSWDRLRPYSLNNTLIIESTPETSGARLLITLDRADVKEDGESVIDWAQYDNAGADVWQPKKFKFIPLKDEHGELIKDDDGKILATRKVSKYGKVTIHDADLFPWLTKKREQKYEQLERIIASEIKERDAKRAALLGADAGKWADNLAQIVKRFFDATKLTQERSVLGQEIACAFIASRLGFDLDWNADAEKKDAARLLALCIQGDKKHDTTGHALQVVLKHVNKCVASILYQSQPTAIKPREETPAPAPTVEPKTEAPAPVEPDDDDNARKEAVKELLESLDSFNAAIAYAATTGGIVHLQKAEEIKKEVESLIERADNLNALDSKTLAYFETLCKNIAIVAIKNNLARLIDDTSRNWDQYQRAALQTLREIETSKTVQKNDKLQWRFTDAFSSVVESKTSDDVRTILKNLVNAI